MEEVLAPRPERAQEIIKRLETFNRGESPVVHLEQLYPAMLWMPVEVRAKGMGVKNMPFRFLSTLVRKISRRRSKMAC